MPYMFQTMSQLSYTFTCRHCPCPDVVLQIPSRFDIHCMDVTSPLWWWQSKRWKSDCTCYFGFWWLVNSSLHLLKDHNYIGTSTDLTTTFKWSIIGTHTPKSPPLHLIFFVHHKGFGTTTTEISGGVAKIWTWFSLLANTDSNYVFGYFPGKYSTSVRGTKVDMSHVLKNLSAPQLTEATDQ